MSPELKSKLCLGMPKHKSDYKYYKK
jgi:hypothetical protein